MKRPYLALATLALVAGATPGLIPRVRANGLFTSAAVETASFAVLARPVGNDDWSLVVLEQLQARPFCWTPRPDGLVDPTLNRFDYTGICGRYIDSNGYSLRVGDVDLNHAYRLRVQQRGKALQLLATSASRSTELVVAQGTVPRRDRDLFVSLQLEPGWELRRRMFGDRSLNHVYFANGQSLDALIASAGGRPSEGMGLAPGARLAPPDAPPPLRVRREETAVLPRSRVFTDPRSESIQGRGGRQAPTAQGGFGVEAKAAPAGEAPGAAEGTSAGVVALQVIPYEERTGGGGEASARTGREGFTAAQNP